MNTETRSRRKKVVKTKKHIVITAIAASTLLFTSFMTYAAFVISFNDYDSIAKFVQQVSSWSYYAEPILWTIFLVFLIKGFYSESMLVSITAVFGVYSVFSVSALVYFFPDRYDSIYFIFDYAVCALAYPAYLWACVSMLMPQLIKKEKIKTSFSHKLRVFPQTSTVYIAVCGSVLSVIILAYRMSIYATISRSIIAAIASATKDSLFLVTCAAAAILYLKYIIGGFKDIKHSRRIAKIFIGVFTAEIIYALWMLMRDAARHIKFNIYTDIVHIIAQIVCIISAFFVIYRKMTVPMTLRDRLLK